DEDDAVDAPTWYRDADIDGHGDPGNTTAACERPYGYTADATDCDDARNDVHPGVPENCLTAEDEDCDDADVDGIGCVDWYADLDGDGHAGDPSSVCACSAHDVYTSTTATDCDDEDPLAYAGAPEIWGDGIDQSCGNDGDAADLLTEAVPLYGVAAGDQAGYSLAADGDPDGDGLQGLVVGAPGAESRGGAVYVFATPPTASASLGGADLVLVGSTAGDLVGTSIDTGDIDGDGVADIAVGSTVIGPAGGATVVYGGRTGVHDLATSDLAYLPAEGYAAGHAVAFVGDLDGDGADNLVLGDPTASAEGKPEAGVVHVFGAPSGESPVTEEGIRLTGSSTFGDAGYALLGPGDLDGDGLDDLVVSDPRWSGAGPLNAGAVYVLHGPVTDGDLDTTADVRIEGSHAYAYIGIALARAGDADGDGAPDVLVAASGTGGGVYLVTAPAAGSLVDGARAWLSLSSATSVAGGGDLDADGAGDFVVGQPTGASYSRAGHAYVLYGPAAGTVDLDDTAISLSGGRYSYAGAAVRIVGDTDGDGHDDVLVGAWGDPTRGSQAGVAWFLSGGSL
ncbi:MAG: MopE-related protein, partial [Myxococcota bacterium]